MTRRVFAFVLALAVATGTQGTLMYAAAAAAAGETTDRAVAALGSGPGAVAVEGDDRVSGSLTDEAVLCQRGAEDCFAYGSWNCCTEAMVLGWISISMGNLLAYGVTAFHQWYYC